MRRAWVVSLSFSACAAPAPVARVSALERFPLQPHVVCTDTTVEGGVTLTSTSTEDCRREGERVRCEQTIVEDGETYRGWGEVRVDAQGAWSIGNDVFTIEPPALVFPADAAPGKRWTSESAQVTRGSGERVPTRKDHEIFASDVCADGLRFHAVKQVQVPGGARTESDLVYCPGSDSPRSYTLRTTNGQGLVRETQGSCRAEPAASR